MNEKKARAKRRVETNGDHPDEAPGIVAAAVEEDAAGPVTHPSVLVMRVPGDSPGEERIEIAELNGIDPLAVPTLLRIAANIRQNQLGIPQ